MQESQGVITNTSIRKITDPSSPMQQLNPQTDMLITKLGFHLKKKSVSPLGTNRNKIDLYSGSIIHEHENDDSPCKNKG